MTDWVPLSSIIGGSHLPADAAHVLRTAVQLISEQHAITPENRWQTLELLAAEYMASQHAP